MLKRIVAITFVALLSLALAGTSIAETRHSHPNKKPGTEQLENKKQMEAMDGFKKALQG